MRLKKEQKGSHGFYFRINKLFTNGVCMDFSEGPKCTIVFKHKFKMAVATTELDAGKKKNARNERSPHKDNKLLNLHTIK